MSLYIAASLLKVSIFPPGSAFFVFWWAGVSQRCLRLVCKSDEELVELPAIAWECIYGNDWSSISCHRDVCTGIPLISTVYICCIDIIIKTTILCMLLIIYCLWTQYHEFLCFLRTSFRHQYFISLDLPHWVCFRGNCFASENTYYFACVGTTLC